MITRQEFPSVARTRIETAIGREAPGLTYVFVRAEETIAAVGEGRSDAVSTAPIDPAEPMPLYSMTKAIPALATLESLERRGGHAF